MKRSGIYLGKTISEETRRKIGAASKGRVFSAEVIAKRIATRARNKAAKLQQQETHQ
jgi:hypothetical protein